MIYQSWYQSDHLAEEMFVSVLRSKVILLLLLLLLLLLYYHYYFRFFIIYFAEGNYYVFSTHKSGKLCSWTWWWNVCKNCLKYFYMGDFSSLWVCFFFKYIFYLFEREWREKAWARGAEGEGEAGSLLNREPALGTGSWSEPKLSLIHIWRCRRIL